MSYFISIEGCDGVGKSTYSKMLYGKMMYEGYDVVLTKEPGSEADSTGVCKELREFLLGGAAHNMARGVSDCIFLADHIQHVEKVIKPALEAGKVIISDRYTDSEFAYAQSSKGTQSCILEAYQELYGPEPDLTLLLISPNLEVTLERARQRRDNKQGNKAWGSLSEQQNIQNAYLQYLQHRTRTSTIVIDLNKSPEQMFEVVWSTVSYSLSLPRNTNEQEGQTQLNTI